MELRFYLAPEFIFLTINCDEFLFPVMVTATKQEKRMSGLFIGLLICIRKWNWLILMFW